MIHELTDHRAFQCKCGGNDFLLLQSGSIQCKDCGEKTSKMWDWEVYECNCHSYNLETGYVPEGVVCLDKDISVDNCITIVIGELNRNGCETLGSCCGHGKERPSIVFASGVDFNKARQVIESIGDKRKFQFLQWRLCDVTNDA